MQMRDAIGNGGKTKFMGYGDLSLTELLPALLTRYSETEMMIVAPAVPDQAAEIITRWMKKQWPRMDGRGRLNVVSKLTVVADLSEESSPMASQWLNGNPFDGRLVPVSHAQGDTALLLPDIAVTGPLNMRYGQNFVCNVTTVREEVDRLWKQYGRMAVRQAKRTARKKLSEGQETVVAAVIEEAARKEGDEAW